MTATAITKALRKMWPAPIRMRATVTPSGEVQVVAGSGLRGHTEAVAQIVGESTGQTWTVSGVESLRGHTGAIRITLALNTTREG